MFKKFCAVIMIMAIVVLCACTACADNWPTVNDSRTIAFIATHKFPVYRDPGCSVRGTVVPDQEYADAEIWAGDDCFVVKIYNNSSLLVDYPASGIRKQGYVRRTDVFESLPQEFWAAAHVDTYTGPSGSRYGSIDQNDHCFMTATTSGSYPYGIIYPITNNRWKYGFVSAGDYNKIKGSSITTTATLPQPEPVNSNATTYTKTVTLSGVSTFEQWCGQLKKQENQLTGANITYATAKQKEYNGTIIVNREILSYKKVKATFPGNTQGPGLSAGTKTAYVYVPIKIKYTLHKHDVKLRCNAQTIGTLVSGLVEGNVNVIYTCSCGLSELTSWVMPITDDILKQPYTGKDLYVKTTVRRK